MGAGGRVSLGEAFKDRGSLDRASKLSSEDMVL